MTEREDISAVPVQADLLRTSAVGRKNPVWLHAWRSIRTGWLVAVVGLCAVSVAIVVAGIVLFEKLNVDGFAGLSLLAFFALGPLGMAVPLSGIGSARLSPFVRQVDVAGVGTGLLVPGRGDILVRAGLLALTSMSGLWWYAIQNDPPDRRQAKAELVTLIGTPACLLWFLATLFIVNRTKISLHPEGIVQVIYRRRAWAVTTDITVIPWDEIADLQPRGHPNPAMPHPASYPTIRVVRRATADESDEDALVLMACEKKVEPNSLLALLQWCHDNPWARAQLAGTDAPELLRPPSLLERIRADRAAARSLRQEAGR